MCKGDLKWHKRTFSDRIYMVLKMWHLSNSMETRLKHKIVHNFPLFAYKKHTVSRGNWSHMTTQAGKHVPHKSCTRKPLNVSCQRQRVTEELPVDFICSIKLIYVGRIITWSCLHEIITKTKKNHKNCTGQKNHKNCTGQHSTLQNNEVESICL